MKERLKTTALFMNADNVRLTAIPQILEILMFIWSAIDHRTQHGCMVHAEDLAVNFGIALAR